MAEQALKDSENKFRLISEQSLVGIQFIQDGLVKYANHAYCDMTGFSIDEIMNWKPYEHLKLVHPDDREFVIKNGQIRQSATSDATSQYEFRGVTKNGEAKWIELYATTFLYQEKKATLVMYIDITERKKAQQALQESEERFRLLSAAAFDGIIIHQGGILIRANDQYYKMFGYEAKELRGKQVLPLTIAPEALETAHNKIAAGSMGPYKATGLRKDGTRFPIEVRARDWEHEGRQVRVAAIMDMTEPKRAEEMLQYYNRRLQILHQIDRDILIARSPKEIVNAVLQHIRGLVPCWMASVALYERETGQIIVLASEVSGDTMILPGAQITRPSRVGGPDVDGKLPFRGRHRHTIGTDLAPPSGSHWTKASAPIWPLHWWSREI